MFDEQGRLPSALVVVNGQGVADFVGEYITNEERFRRVDADGGGYMLGRRSQRCPTPVLDCFDTVGASDTDFLFPRCVASCVNSANNLYCPKPRRRLTCKDNNCRLSDSVAGARLVAREGSCASPEKPVTLLYA